MRKRAQAAMEFLMTYGWAILVIIIVIAVLFYMGVMNPKSAAVNSCIFAPGFSCYTIRLAEGSGLLSLDLGQATGGAISVTGIGCSGGTTASPTTLTNPVYVPSGEHRFVVGGDSGNLLNCTIENGAPIPPADAQLGERYRGKICVDYTTLSDGQSHSTCSDVSTTFEGSGSMSFSGRGCGPRCADGSACSESSQCLSGSCSVGGGGESCPVCGDGVCEMDKWETQNNCPDDCGLALECPEMIRSSCGNGVCENGCYGPAESFESCSDDCPVDCGSGGSGLTGCTWCPGQLLGEGFCSSDPGCRMHELCDLMNPTGCSCMFTQKDCAGGKDGGSCSVCGDGVCGVNEGKCNCPDDCGLPMGSRPALSRTCGNGVCEYTHGDFCSFNFEESADNCPEDCCASSEPAGYGTCQACTSDCPAGYPCDDGDTCASGECDGEKCLPVPTPVPTPNPNLPCGSTIEACCTIASEGEYVLGADLEYSGPSGACITITSGGSSSTIDCGGSTITGTGAGEGIALNAASEVTVSNCVVTNFDNGIHLDSSDNNYLTSNTVSNIAMYGIYLSSSSYNNLDGNIASDNTNYGILLDGSDNNDLDENTASNNAYIGIELGSSSYNNLNGNIASNNAQYGVALLSSNNNNLDGNTASDNNDYGVYLQSSNSNILTGNSAADNTNGGILLYNSDYNDMDGSTISNCDYGVAMTYSESNSVTNNEITGGYSGISVSHLSNGNTISGNTVTSQSNSGIYLSESDNNEVLGNTVESNRWGVLVEADCDDNTFTDNAVTGNSELDFYCTFTSVGIDGDGNTCETQNGCDSWLTSCPVFNPAISVCKTITMSGSYYLTQDITHTGTCLTINADYVTIDGMGHTIWGPGWLGGAGIRVNGINADIRNLTVRTNLYGILVYGTGAHIEDVTLYNTQQGIMLNSGSNGAEITGNTFTENQGALWIDSNENAIDSNDIYCGTASWDGLSGDTSGIVVTAMDNTFFGDTVSSCSGYGIALLAANAQNNQIESETVSGCGKGVWLSNAGAGNALLNNAVSSSGAWDIVCEGASASSRTGNACSTSSKACSGCTPGVCTTAACN